MDPSTGTEAGPSRWPRRAAGPPRTCAIESATGFRPGAVQAGDQAAGAGPLGASCRAFPGHLADAGDLERAVGLVVGLTDRDVLALDEAMAAQAVTRLVVVRRAVVVVDQPGRADLASRPVHEAA